MSHVYAHASKMPLKSVRPEEGRKPNEGKRRKIESDLRDQFIIKGVVGLLIFMPLALGAVHSWSSSLAELAVFLCATVFAVKTLEKGYFVLPLPAAWPFICLLLLLALVQTFPAPLRLLEIVSPATAFLRRTASGSVAAEGFRTLSLYPCATVGAFSKLAAFMALFLIVVNLFRTEGELKKLALAIACVGFAVAFIGLLQQRANAEGIYGFWRSRYWKVGQGSFCGTFVNKNHFAGYMEMAIPLTIALAVRQSRRGRSKDLFRRLADADSPIFQRFFLLFCASIMLWTLFRSGSAGGITSLIAASFIVLVTLAIRIVSGRRRLFLLASFLLVCIGVSMGANSVSPHILSMVDSARLHVWRDSLRMALEFPWFGVGLGAYRYGFPIYQTLEGGIFYNHAHNDYVEFLAETGLVGSACMFVTLLAFVAVPIHWLIKRQRLQFGPLAIASLIGVLSLLLHAIVDFNFHITANALTFAVVAGITLNSMLPYYTSAPRFHEIRILPSGRSLKYGCAGAASLCVLLSLATISASAASIHCLLAESSIKKDGARGWEIALRRLKAARVLDPINSEYAYARGRICEERAGRSDRGEAQRTFFFEQAASEYASAVRLEPTNALYHLSLGYALAVGRPASATDATDREFRLARLLYPSRVDIEQYVTRWQQVRDGVAEGW
ncbi:O-antigen ligase family protein [Candidatus Poribacteria bacterium]|nr:O-antigen ligase family protein [Candidatus Poribacteria bacterium]